MESYVNLIPTVQDGSHVNGFRTGLTDALREFCEFRNLLPRGIKLAPVSNPESPKASCGKTKSATPSIASGLP